MWWQCPSYADCFGDKVFDHLSNIASPQIFLPSFAISAAGQLPIYMDLIYFLFVVTTMTLEDVL